jgi:transcriptional regulator with XRE-family HTH domain
MPTRPISARTAKAAGTLGEYLATFRKLQGLTAAQVADRAGVTRNTLRRLEHGETSVGLDVFLEVSRVLGVLDFVLQGMNPYETALGQSLAQAHLDDERKLPQRVRP